MAIIVVFLLGGFSGMYIQAEHNVVNTEVTKVEVTNGK